VDPGDSAALAGSLAELGPDIVINLVAMTDVDGCERDPAAAYQANAAVVESICEAMKTCPSAHLIHISSDQVYSGPGVHVESDVTPLNVYAITKLAGEMIAIRQGATVFRVNFVGRSRAPTCRGLTDWLVESLRSGIAITLFRDVFFSPLHVMTLCRAIECGVLIATPGVFNLGARGGMSKADFAIGLARRLQLSQERVTVGSVDDRRMLARRPSNMVMDSGRFEKAFGFELPCIESELDLVAADYQ
jgi:dTDP-4-dehydrorhamnose reductase